MRLTGRRGARGGIRWERAKNSGAEKQTGTSAIERHRLAVAGQSGLAKSQTGPRRWARGVWSGTSRFRWLVLLAVGLGLGPGALRAQVSLPPALELRVPKPPTVATGDGEAFLAYELHITNFAAQAVRLREVEVTARGASSRTVLLSLTDSVLARSLTRPGVSLGPDQRTELAGGMRAVVFLWVPIPAGQRPEAVVNRVVIEQGAGDSVRVAELAAPALPIQPAEPAIGAPLRGGVWLTGNGPAPLTGHRRALIVVDGQPAIAQRFGIDYVKVDGQNQTFTGDRLKNSSYFAYGEEAIAVADGIVVGTKDSIPENIPGPASRAVPITLETVGGNYVMVDIGGGRIAFYAHVQPGSLRVRVGDRVRRGQVLALVGNSGNSTEPHLHFHIADGISPLASEGVPYGVDAFDVLGRCRVFNLGCERSASEPRRSEQPLGNLLVRFRD